MASLHYVFDCPGALEEGDLGGGLLVKQGVGQDFCASELCHWDGERGVFLLGGEYVDVGQHGYVVVDSLLHLLFLGIGSLVVYGLGECLGAFDAHVYGLSGEVVGCEWP